jgi:hypothetical protein
MAAPPSPTTSAISDDAAVALLVGAMAATAIVDTAVATPVQPDLVSVRRALMVQWVDGTPTEQAIVKLRLDGQPLPVSSIEVYLGSDNVSANQLASALNPRLLSGVDHVPLFLSAFLYNRGLKWTEELNQEMMYCVVKGRLTARVFHKKICSAFQERHDEEKFRRTCPIRRGKLGVAWEVRFLLDNGYVRTAFEQYEGVGKCVVFKPFDSHGDSADAEPATSKPAAGAAPTDTAEHKFK